MIDTTTYKCPAYKKNKIKKKIGRERSQNSGTCRDRENGSDGMFCFS